MLPVILLEPLLFVSLPFADEKGCADFDCVQLQVTALFESSFWRLQILFSVDIMSNYGWPVGLVVSFLKAFA